MRKYLVLGMAVAGAAAAPAHAAPSASISYTPGVYTLPGYCLPACKVFEDFENGGASDTSYNPATQSKAGSPTETPTGVVLNAAGNTTGVALNPDNDGNKYLAIGGNAGSGQFTVALGGAQFFSFSFGSLDSYNSLTLTFVGGGSQTFVGQQIIGGSAPTGTTPVNYADTGRVSFNAGGGAGFASAIFSSTQAAFEIDDLASAAPEPATWALMILGFGLVGSHLRSRHAKGQVAFA